VNQPPWTGFLFFFFFKKKAECAAQQIAKKTDRGNVFVGVCFFLSTKDCEPNWRWRSFHGEQNELRSAFDIADAANRSVHRSGFRAAESISSLVFFRKRRKVIVVVSPRSTIERKRSQIRYVIFCLPLARCVKKERR